MTALTHVRCHSGHMYPLPGSQMVACPVCVRVSPMTPHTCQSCATTTDVWTCRAGTYCWVHLPVDAGAVWRVGEVAA